MEYQKLNNRVSDLLRDGLQNRDYSDIRQTLISEGYAEEEVKYMMEIVDEKGIIPTAEEVQKDRPNRNIVLGGIMCLIAMITVGTLFMGQKAPKEVYYVALVIFALGYYILRTGLKQRSDSKESQKS